MATETTGPTLTEIEAARRGLADVARVTPVYASDTFSRLAAREVVLCAALARESVKQARRPRIIVQVNTGSEPQKAGVLPDAADELITACRETFDLDVAGVMCIPPVDESPVPHYTLLAKIAARNGLTVLSMGMSNDFPSAIAHGATHVRVGTAIFGARSVG